MKLPDGSHPKYPVFSLRCLRCRRPSAISCSTPLSMRNEDWSIWPNMPPAPGIIPPPGPPGAPPGPTGPPGPGGFAFPITIDSKVIGIIIHSSFMLDFCSSGATQLFVDQSRGAECRSAQRSHMLCSARIVSTTYHQERILPSGAFNDIWSSTGLGSGGLWLLVYTFCVPFDEISHVRSSDAVVSCPRFWHKVIQFFTAPITTPLMQI
ncbi:hypothetical protein Ciccas_008715 [Cichlidogyrus casuarinus]|uniref:Uncharacterized protein n=1 Tax=Cichlidogyrus casuarinus TaxID=1844966 RepID=A0ABD2Q1T8_9PLAT